MRVGLVVMEQGGRATVQISPGGRNSCGLTGATGKELSHCDWVTLVLGGLSMLYYQLEIPAGMARKLLVPLLREKLASVLPIEPADICWFFRPAQNHWYEIAVARRSDIEARLAEVPADLRFDQLLPEGWSEEPGRIRDAVMADAQWLTRYRPPRYRRTRWCLRGTLFGLCVVTALIVWRGGADFQREAAAQAAALEQLRTVLRGERQRSAELMAQQELLTLLRERGAVPASPLPVLAALTNQLPDEMWVTNFSQNGDAMELSINSTRDEVNLYRRLEASDVYRIVNLRKNRGPRNTTVYYLKLQGKGTP